MAWNVWNITRESWMNLTSYPTRDAAHAAMIEVFAEMAGGKLEVRQVGAVLEHHGTKLMQLKPSMIWACAMADLERRRHNGMVVEAREAPKSGLEFKQYAFHRRHVLKANTANDVIRAAIAEPALGQASGKRDTRLIYSDVELLKAALR